MTTTGTGRPGAPKRPADRLILRGYGPLAALIVVIIIVTMLVPSRPKSDDVTQFLPDQSTGFQQQPDTTSTGQQQAPAAGGTQLPGNTTPGPGANPTKGGGKQQATTNAVGPGVAAATNCSGGAKQDGNTAYSPACVAWAGGDNGGATTRGVTKDTITVAYRDVGNPLGDDDPELSKTAEKKGIVASPEATERTRQALLAYFNQTYQLYGRKVKIVTYKGRGDFIKELGGTGQEAANSDGLKVGQELKAFADMTAISQPYLDALVRQKVVAFGGLHLPASYYTARAPYAWGQLIDCTALLDSAVDLMSKRFPATG